MPVWPRAGRLGWGRASTQSRVDSDSGYATFVKESKDLIQKVPHHWHLDHYMHEWLMGAIEEGDLEVNLNDLKEDGDCDQALRRPVNFETSRQGAQGLAC